MRVSGFSFVRNAIDLYYPVVESIRSALPICDEFVIAAGDSTDGTDRAAARHRRPQAAHHRDGLGPGRSSCAAPATPCRPTSRSTPAPATGRSTCRPTRSCTRTTSARCAERLRAYRDDPRVDGLRLRIPALLRRLRPLPDRRTTGTGARCASCAPAAASARGRARRASATRDGRKLRVVPGRRAHLPLRLGAPAAPHDAQDARPRRGPSRRRRRARLRPRHRRRLRLRPPARPRAASPAPTRASCTSASRPATGRCCRRRRAGSTIGSAIALLSWVENRVLGFRIGEHRNYVLLPS